MMDIREMVIMSDTILQGNPFEFAVTRGVADTPDNRALFEELKVDHAELDAAGLKPEYPFD